MQGPAAQPDPVGGQLRLQPAGQRVRGLDQQELAVVVPYPGVAKRDTDSDEQSETQAVVRLDRCGPRRQRGHCKGQQHVIGGAEIPSGIILVGAGLLAPQCK